MTATQVFFLFLKEECLIDEMRFFKWAVMKETGNRYFRKRPLFKPTFVEDYLSRNNRTLSNFMIRLFILAPSLKHFRHNNPRWKIIVNDFRTRNEGKIIKRKRIGWNDEIIESEELCLFHPYRCGMYVNYYRRKWNKFLNEKIESDKKFNSPFKKGESYDFKLKT